MSIVFPMKVQLKCVYLTILVCFLGQAYHCIGQGEPNQIETAYFDGDWKAADARLTQWEKVKGRSVRTDAAYLKVRAIGQYYHYEVESAEQSLRTAFDIASGNSTTLLQAEIKEWLGHVYMKRSEPDLAIQAYQEALDIRKSSQLSDGLSDFYLNYFLASAYFLNHEQEKENEKTPFITTNWKHGSKPLKVSGSDSLVFSIIQRGMEGLVTAGNQTNYKYSLLFTTLPRPSVSPEKYEDLLNKMGPALTGEIRDSPLSITLLAQTAIWHLGYYQYLIEEYGNTVPVVTRKPENDFLKIGKVSKKGRVDQRQVEQNVTRLHQRTDLKSFNSILAALQKVVPVLIPHNQTVLAQVRNQSTIQMGDVSKTNRKLFQAKLEQIETQKNEVQKLKESTAPNARARLNEIDPNQIKDIELYTDYLLRSSYSLDSAVFAWFQSTLALMDDKLAVRMERNPNVQKVSSIDPFHEPAFEALLLKAAYQYELAQTLKDGPPTLLFTRAPFFVSFTNEKGMPLDAGELFSKQALLTWKTYEDIYDILLNQLGHAADRYYWAGYIHTHRLTAMDAAFAGVSYKARTPDELKKMNDAFFFSERTKATVYLNDMAQGVHARLSHLQPDDRQKTDSLLQHMHFLENRLRAGSKTARDSITLIEKQLEKLFPSGSLTGKDDVLKIPTLMEVQQTLDQITAIIWWVTTPDNLYRFVLTTKELKVSVTLRKEEKNLMLIKGMRNGIVYQKEDVYRESAQTLYKRIFPNIEEEIQNLILIPDQEMNLIPFEALLTERVSKKEIGQWTLYPFLTKRFSISYDVSVSSHWLRQQKPTALTFEFLGYAPVFSDHASIGNGAVRSLQNIFEQIDQEGNSRSFVQADQVAPLPATRSEIESIASVFQQARFPVKTYVEQSASEKSFRDQPISSSSIVHLATHGFANPHQPSECGILMADITHPSQDDGVLYGYEIAMMNLPAQLITLSACETGLGKVVAGEGSLSLTRNFLLAGAQNVLSSLWKVSDEETSKLMISFYQHMIQKISSPLSLSLREAKLDLINSGKGDPYYWSSFILTGK